MGIKEIKHRTYLQYALKKYCMGIFDFLNDLGESKDNYEVVKTTSNIQEKVKYLEILENRNLISGNFKSEILELLINKKISDDVFYSNVDKSVKAHNDILLAIDSINEALFHQKNNIPEYVGAIERLDDRKSDFNPSRGKASYNFVFSLFQHLKSKKITLQELNALSDALEFSVLKVFNVTQLSDR